MFWPVFCMMTLATAGWLYWRYKHRRMLKMAKKIPGPPTVPGLGNALMFMCRPEEVALVIKELIEVYGDFVKFWLGPDLNVVVSDPDDVRVLLTNPKVNVKGPQYKYMADYIGAGILSGSGPTWRKHRKIASPNYGKRTIEGYTDVFNAEVDLLLNVLRATNEEKINVYDPVVRCTSYSVCQTLMGLTKEQTMKLPHLHQVIRVSPHLYDLVFARMTKWYLQIDPFYWLTKYHQTANKYRSYLSEFSCRIVKLRLEHIERTGENMKHIVDESEDDVKNTQLSVIDRFIMSQELDAHELADETFTVFTSSQEASAKISSAILLMLAYNPRCQEQLYAEIRSVIGDADRAVTNEDLNQMPYLEMVFKEAIRMFPIGAMLQRTVAEDMTIASGTIPAGSALVVPIYHMQRDPRFWKNPNDFDPERFTPENSKGRHPHCYIPFSLGSMDCLGRYIGPKLIKTICVRVLREFRAVAVDSYQDLKVSIAISASPINGYPLKLIPRG